MKILLVDNGSLRPDSTFSLRRLAAELSAVSGKPVDPVSLLHANRVDPTELKGSPAWTLEPYIRYWAEKGERVFAVIPLFFGPSRALTEYIPQRESVLRDKFPGLRILVGETLVRTDRSEDLSAIGSILFSAVRETLVDFPARSVVLVDHGTPVPGVTEIRNKLAEWLNGELEGMGLPVYPASMERRPGPEYAFNEPLLESILLDPDRVGERVVLSMLFLQPGRHAGPGGDVDTIAHDATGKRRSLEYRLTPLVAEHPELVAILARRLEALLANQKSAKTA